MKKVKKKNCDRSKYTIFWYAGFKKQLFFGLPSKLSWGSTFESFMSTKGKKVREKNFLKKSVPTKGPNLSTGISFPGIIGS